MAPNLPAPHSSPPALKSPSDLLEELDARLVARHEQLQQTLADWVGYADKMRADQYTRELAAFRLEMLAAQQQHEESLKLKFDELIRTISAALKIVDRSRHPDTVG
jgi:hypothetical protein